MQMQKAKSIFIIWHNYQSRVENMQSYFKYNIFYINKRNKFKLVEYFVNFFKTLKLLFIEKPNVVWIQLPPTPLLYTLCVYKCLNKDVVIISDCHNGMLRKPWINTPFAKTLINRLSTIILVHNDVVFERNVKKGFLNSNKSYVLEDLYPTRDLSRLSNKNTTKKNKFIIFPASFNDDEPIEEIIQCADLLPDVNFYITGSKKKFEAKFKHYIKSLPTNFIVVGWLEEDEYFRLLKNANVVLGLTKYDDIQLSVANEAVGFEKAMVLSDTITLKKLFHKGAIYSKNNALSLSKAITYAIDNQQELEQQTKSLKLERLKGWYNQAEGLSNLLKNLLNNPK